MTGPGCSAIFEQGDIMKARKLKLERIIERLKDIERDSTMGNANFDPMGSASMKYPIKNKEVTPFIKEATRIWRASWIIEPLQDIIKQLEFEMNR